MRRDVKNNSYEFVCACNVRMRTIKDLRVAFPILNIFSVVAIVSEITTMLCIVRRARSMHS